ncbi:MAG TPA: hypothetical protein VM867_05685 [Xanthobacteraceae bacterium]|nr:hypothetical protein [Xanthobacteraceae bacterium]
MLRMSLVAAVVILASNAMAQDVIGIENCSAEKAIERRVGCMQSNINYLHQQMMKTNAEGRQRLDAANQRLDAATQRLEAAGREIAALKETVAKLQVIVGELQAGAKKAEPKGK